VLDDLMVGTWMIEQRPQRLHRCATITRPARCAGFG
jgi:hypothetical protein